MSLSILIVEDNQDTADTMAFLIETWGHHPCVAYDGAAGWKAACDQRLDCLILAINLPKIDGYTLARRLLKGRLHEAKLMAISARPNDADGQADGCQSKRSTTVVTKPNLTLKKFEQAT